MSTVKIIDSPTINVPAPVAFDVTEFIKGVLASIVLATSIPSLMLLTLPAWSVAITPINCKGIVMSASFSVTKYIPL